MSDYSSDYSDDYYNPSASPPKGAEGAKASSVANRSPSYSSGKSAGSSRSSSGRNPAPVSGKKNDRPPSAETIETNYSGEEFESASSPDKKCSPKKLRAKQPPEKHSVHISEKRVNSQRRTSGPPTTDQIEGKYRDLEIVVGKPPPKTQSTAATKIVQSSISSHSTPASSPRSLTPTSSRSHNPRGAKSNEAKPQSPVATAKTQIQQIDTLPDSAEDDQKKRNSRVKRSPAPISDAQTPSQTSHCLSAKEQQALLKLLQQRDHLRHMVAEVRLALEDPHATTAVVKQEKSRRKFIESIEEENKELASSVEKLREELANNAVSDTLYRLQKEIRANETELKNLEREKKKLTEELKQLAKTVGEDENIRVMEFVKKQEELVSEQDANRLRHKRNMDDLHQALERISANSMKTMERAERVQAIVVQEHVAQIGPDEFAQLQKQCDSNRKHIERLKLSLSNFETSYEIPAAQNEWQEKKLEAEQKALEKKIADTLRLIRQKEDLIFTNYKMKERPAHFFDPMEPQKMPKKAVFFQKIQEGISAPVSPVRTDKRTFGAHRRASVDKNLQPKPPQGHPALQRTVALQHVNSAPQLSLPQKQSEQPMIVVQPPPSVSSESPQQTQKTTEKNTSNFFLTQESERLVEDGGDGDDFAGSLSPGIPRLRSAETGSILSLQPPPAGDSDYSEEDFDEDEDVDYGAKLLAAMDDQNPKDEQPKPITERVTTPVQRLSPKKISEVAEESELPDWMLDD